MVKLDDMDEQPALHRHVLQSGWSIGMSVGAYDRSAELPSTPQPQKPQAAPPVLPTPVGLLRKVKAKVIPRVEQLFIEFLVDLELKSEEPLEDDMSIELEAGKQKDDRPEVIELVLKKFGPDWVAELLQGELDTKVYSIRIRPANEVSVMTYLMSNG